MGLSPDTWGPCLWNAIHTLCIGAPDVIPPVIQVQYTTYFNALPYVLPCSKCTKHLIEIYKKYPIDQYVDGKKNLFKWSVLVHNEVNISTGKEPMDVDSAYNYWEKKLKEGKVANSQYKKSLNWVWLYITVVLLFIALMYYYIFRKMK